MGRCGLEQSLYQLALLFLSAMKTFLKVGRAFCILLLLSGSAFAIADKDGSKIGDFPPPLTLSKVFQGPKEMTWDKLKGKVVVLEFWATWCGPCVKAIPHLNDLVEQFHGKPVVFLSVTSENEDVVRLFLKKHPINSWIALDDYEKLNKAFHVQGIPHAVIVNAQGRIAAITHPAALAARHLEEVLARKKCSLPEPEVYTTARDASSEVISSTEPALFEISIRQRKLPERIRGPVCSWSHDPDGLGFEGQIATVESALNFVFDKTPCRISLQCKLPEDYYDFRLRAPAGRFVDLADQFIAALRSTFGLEVKRTARNMDVYLLTQISTNAPGFQKVEKSGGGGAMAGGFRFHGREMDTVVEYLENALRKPVFDDTHLKGFFDIDMKWKVTASAQEFEPEPDAVVAAARARLGLLLTPAQRSVEILEVRKASQPSQ